MSAPQFTRIEIESGPDSLGRYHFTLHWWDDYHAGHPDGAHEWRERGQCFHARLDAYARELTRKGGTLVANDLTPAEVLCWSVYVLSQKIETDPECVRKLRATKNALATRARELDPRDDLWDRASARFFGEG